MSDRTTVVGVFTNRTQAQDAVADLRRAGFTEQEIGVVSHDEERPDTHAGDSGDAVTGGAVAGAAAGAGVGALWGLGIMAGLVPAIGPVIAGGTLAAILASAATGAAVAGLAGALLGMGLSREEAEYYEGEFRQGRTVVTVHTLGRADEARMILDRFGAYDYTTRPSMAGSTMHEPTHHHIDVPVSSESVVGKEHELNLGSEFDGPDAPSRTEPPTSRESRTRTD
jgi:hypothetical protein